MTDYIFEITNPEHWKNLGYSKNNGEDLDIEKLQNDLTEKINSKILLVSGDLLINFGSAHNNANAEFLFSRNDFELAQVLFQVRGNYDPSLYSKLSGDVVRGIKVRSKTGDLPYRWRI